MAPRKRLLKTLNHIKPDLIPLDLGATESSGITVSAYNILKKELGIPGVSKVFDMSQMLAKVDFQVLKIIGGDLIPLLIEPKKWKKWTMPDGAEVEIPEKIILRKNKNGSIEMLDKDGNVLKIYPKNGLYFDTVFHPLSGLEDLSEFNSSHAIFKNYDWPIYLDEDFNDLKEKAKKLYEETDYAIVGNLWVHLLAAGQELRGFEDFMMDLVANKKMADHIFSKQLEAYLPRIDKYIESVGKYIDIIQVNDDLGTQSGLQFSPELYREIIKPYHKKLWQYIKERSSKPILLHSCGSIYELIPDLIEMGVDAINPIQVSARNMDTKKLKKEFGKYITFWGGGCDTQKVLSRGSTKDVREEVKRRINDLSQEGGFVFCQVHNIQPDVPVKNILAMYDEFSKNR
ncbi:uroporphyrinogen decarboxylase family protein [Actinomycetota bacterium]